uniref:Uncharacterized protein n=1 Tax=Rangifer tarandus platyrhynchus TaxID=3082113 RepID=A0ACB0F876_RANTA|nr:unnamed protein product [Rangifer tarandus platyrhynchus]
MKQAKRQTSVSRRCAEANKSDTSRSARAGSRILPGYAGRSRRGFEGERSGFTSQDQVTERLQAPKTRARRGLSPGPHKSCRGAVRQGDGHKNSSEHTLFGAWEREAGKIIAILSAPGTAAFHMFGAPFQHDSL